MAHLIILITDHRSEMSFVGQLDRFDAKARAENAIERSGRAATLQMPQHATARLLSSALRNLARDNVADSSKSKFAVLGLAFYLLTIFGSSAFCYNNERAEITGSVTRFDRSRDSVVIERDFRNQNNIGASCDSAVQRDPASMAPHYFDNHHAFMADGGGVQSAARVHHGMDCGIQSELHCRGFKVIVDGFGNSDAIDARLLQLLGGHH